MKSPEKPSKECMAGIEKVSKSFMMTAVIPVSYVPLFACLKLLDRVTTEECLEPKTYSTRFLLRRGHILLRAA